MSPGAAEKNSFLLKVRLLAVPQLNLLLRRLLKTSGARRIGRGCRNAQVPKGDINNNLIVYLYRLLAFEI